MGARVRALIAGLEADMEKRIKDALGRTDIHSIRDANDFIKQVESMSPENLHMLVCGPSIPGLPAIELAQSLKYQVPGRPLLYLSSAALAGNSRDLLKNGFDEAFFLPLDAPRLQKTLQKMEGQFLGEATANLISVPLEGLQPGSIVDFDVMVLLPLNNKYVRLFKKGSLVRPEVLAKFAGQDLKVIFISEDDKAGFQNYVQQHNASGAFELLQRRNHVQSEIIQLFHSLLAPDQGTFQEGKLLLGRANEIVNRLTGLPGINEILTDVFKLTGQEQGDFYDQALRVSTYASLFSLLLKCGNPEDIAIAGLFHHVGLVRIPENLLNKSWKEMSTTERTEYKQHPQFSVRIVNEKKIVLPPDAQNAILSHHERPDGQGYPRALPESKIPVGASLLAMASAFDDLTTLKPGHRRFTVKEAGHELLKTEIAPLELLRMLERALSSK